MYQRTVQVLAGVLLAALCFCGVASANSVELSVATKTKKAVKNTSEKKQNTEKQRLSHKDKSEKIISSPSKSKHALMLRKEKLFFHRQRLGVTYSAMETGLWSFVGSYAFGLLVGATHLERGRNLGWMAFIPVVGSGICGYYSFLYSSSHGRSHGALGNFPGYLDEFVGVTGFIAMAVQAWGLTYGLYNLWQYRKEKAKPIAHSVKLSAWYDGNSQGLVVYGRF